MAGDGKRELQSNYVVAEGLPGRNARATVGATRDTSRAEAQATVGCLPGTTEHQLGATRQSNTCQLPLMTYPAQHLQALAR